MCVRRFGTLDDLSLLLGGIKGKLQTQIAKGAKASMGERIIKSGVRKVCMCAVTVVVLAVLCSALHMLGDGYRLLTPYYDPADVMDTFEAASHCLSEQLGQFGEIQGFVDAAAEEDLTAYASMYEYYTDCLKADRYYMEQTREHSMNTARKMMHQGDVFKWSGHAFDLQLYDALACRGYVRSRAYEHELQMLNEIVWDEALREQHAQVYIDLMSAVIEADGEVSVSLYQLVVRQLASMRELQRGDYSGDHSAFDCLSEAQIKELFHLADNNLRELYMPRLHALWEAEHALEAYTERIMQQTSSAPAAQKTEPDEM